MQRSIWPSSTRPIDEILSRATEADTTGWDGFWVADHYMPNTGDTTVSDGAYHECWTLMPAVAALTERVRIGPLVSPTTVHHPALLANRATTIDHLSDGRFVLGIGAGWQINEHAAYGIELPPPGERVSRFAEAIQIVRSLLSEERTTFHGTYYEVADAPCKPLPVQSPLPILVGTGSPRMLRLTARYADEWNTWGDPDVAGERLAAHADACGSVGRDPSTMRRSVQAMIVFADGHNSERIDQFRNGLPSGRSIIGSPEEIIDAIGRYRDIGFDEVIVPDFHLDGDRGPRDELYERLRTEVFPAVS